ncbi:MULTISPECIES: hypothetical protein [Burkholderia cepacia complex]|uniref:Uncharacterized protein n=1 Tax=Burkholderia vietnamiensis TaxID=60552 RepID=A0AAW7T0F1_BURVI|nr:MULTISPECIES: hypothetical protein [Burkholderia cepacia complex]MCA7948487.1 hypothetical protein [Burkholderia vietnamiensis]MDN7413508.1 hypothetical protein [Burkholderia vietnamiensis]MDN7795820.1 hypothetical protein [Burkholderia vietnamiensis]RQR03194.1 hypothetical protein DF025_32555 [Burkholderia stagnalis]RQR12391.1 hypothetical protein DF026_32700 [Burkholderia stagnalis]
MPLTQTKTAAASIPNAPAGKTTQFVDSTGVVQQKDESGNVFPVGAPVSVATYASLPASPRGLFLVLADETKGGNPTIYLFTATHRYWVAMVQDA